MDSTPSVAISSPIKRRIEIDPLPARQTSDVGLTDTELIRNQRRGGSRESFRDGDFFKYRAVKENNALGRFSAHLFNKVSEALLNEADLARPELLGLRPAVRSKDGDASATAQVVLPFVGGGMPVQCADASRLQAHGDARDVLRRRELHHRSRLEFKPADISISPSRRRAIQDPWRSCSSVRERSQCLSERRTGTEIETEGCHTAIAGDSEFPDSANFA